MTNDHAAAVPITLLSRVLEQASDAAGDLIKLGEHVRSESLVLKQPPIAVPVIRVDRRLCRVVPFREFLLNNRAERHRHVELALDLASEVLRRFVSYRKGGNLPALIDRLADAFRRGMRLRSDQLPG